MSGAFHFRRDEPEEAGLGLTPLIDVVFLLLIFFVVATSFAAPRIPLDLPSARTGESGGPETLRVTVTAEGAVLLDGSPVDEGALAQGLAERAGAGAELELHADGRVPHARIVEIMDLARQHGIGSVAIGVEAAGEAGATRPHRGG